MSSIQRQLASDRTIHPTFLLFQAVIRYSVTMAINFQTEVVEMVQNIKKCWKPLQHCG